MKGFYKEICSICEEGIACGDKFTEYGVPVECNTCGSTYTMEVDTEEVRKEKLYIAIDSFLNFVKSETQGQGGDCSKLERFLEKYLD